MADIDPAKEELLKSDSEFRAWYEEHQQCEKRLDDYQHRELASEEDEIEIKRIKIHKLHLKDQMEARMRQHAAA